MGGRTARWDGSAPGVAAPGFSRNKPPSRVCDVCRGRTRAAKPSSGKARPYMEDGMVDLDGSSRWPTTLHNELLSDQESIRMLEKEARRNQRLLRESHISQS
ncbi:hypothetical protein U9M48_035709 [Paspalum notatum var. saurae]|uniref:Uncharacterized protein n=1 Tax=Paspalum notatum var. saurae TaxID=547442 RepID=A0AAQ3UFN6_PASNO